MKQVILDTSFILSCIRKKIDFFDEIKFMGIKIIIPGEVIMELKGLANSKQEAVLALKLLEKNEFMDISLHSENVDNGIVKAARGNNDYIIATLDREIKKKSKNQKLVIRGKKLEIVA